MWFIIKWWLIKLRWDKLGFGRKGLSISPIRRSNIEEDKCFGINQSELERELLPLKINTCLPNGTPISMQRNPTSHSWPSNPYIFDRTTPTHVRYHHHVEICMSFHCETHSSSSFTCHPILYVRYYLQINFINIK